MNNLQPEDATPKPITPELFGELANQKSAFDVADHEEIHSFTKVESASLIFKRTMYLILISFAENNNSHCISDWPEIREEGESEIVVN